MSDTLALRWAPTLTNAPAPAAEPVSAPAPRPAAAAEPVRAFVTTVGQRTIISAPAETAEVMTAKSILDKRFLRISGRFVGADVPNRNGALWSAGDLEMSAGSVANGPLNWLHEERHVIGTLTKADFQGYTQEHMDEQAVAGTPVHPHITADAVLWRWIWPDEAFVVQQASDSQKLWYSMECISESVQCAGEGGCGNATSYDDYIRGLACAHVTQRAAARQFVNPVFLGGAVIVPPARPGWAEADASVMNEAAKLAPTSYEQAGEPDVTANEWEQLMAQVVRFASS